MKHETVTRKISVPIEIEVTANITYDYGSSDVMPWEEIDNIEVNSAEYNGTPLDIDLDLFIDAAKEAF